MKSRVSKKQIEGVTQAITLLITDKKLRDNFLQNPVETLEYVGVKLRDPRTEKPLIEKLKEVIIEDVNFNRVGVDPGLVSVDIGATVATGAVTGVITGVTTGVTTVVVNVATSDVISEEIIENRLVLDYTKINSLVEKKFQVKGRL